LDVGPLDIGPLDIGPLDIGPLDIAAQPRVIADDWAGPIYSEPKPFRIDTACRRVVCTTGPARMTPPGAAGSGAVAGPAAPVPAAPRC